MNTEEAKQTMKNLRSQTDELAAISNDLGNKLGNAYSKIMREYLDKLDGDDDIAAKDFVIFNAVMTGFLDKHLEFCFQAFGIPKEKVLEQMCEAIRKISFKEKEESQ